MSFNSFQFAVFFIIFYALYLYFNHKWQNRLLIIASCVFYGFWDWRFLSLLFVSLTTDYLSALKIAGTDNAKIRKRFLVLSIVINLSILGFFKYCNFFIGGFQSLFSFFGITLPLMPLNIILPLGISFYTFKTMSYTIDVYLGKIRPTRSYLDYALFVIFFPQLMAGPIERAGSLLPQISSPRKVGLDDFYAGCYSIFWGLYEKIFIADNLAKIVNPVFNSPPPYEGIKVLMGLYAFAFQIFCDFDGYSNIARGLAKCMGFDTMLNFRLPYFSTNPNDFWKRWHISLSNWLHDYIFMPISVANRAYGNLGTLFSLAVTFILCGLWHGAAWMFVIWGMYHAALFVINRMLKYLQLKIRFASNTFPGKAWFWFKVVFFFHVVCIGWLFFKATSMQQALDMLASFFVNPHFVFRGDYVVIKNTQRLIMFIAVLLIFQLVQRKKGDMDFMLKENMFMRGFFYFIIFSSVTLLGAFGAKEFIYFKF